MSVIEWKYPGETEHQWRRDRYEIAGGLIMVMGTLALVAAYGMIVLDRDLPPGGVFLWLAVGLAVIQVTLFVVVARWSGPEPVDWATALPFTAALPVGGAAVVVAWWALLDTWMPWLDRALEYMSLTGVGLALGGFGVAQVMIGLAFGRAGRSVRPFVWTVSLVYLPAFPVGTAVGGYVCWVLIETRTPLDSDVRAA